MLNLFLTLISLVGILILLYTAITNNKNFLYVMLIVKPFIDITVNITYFGGFNGLEISGLLIFLIVAIKYFNQKNAHIYSHTVIWIFLLMQVLTFILAFSVGSQSLITGAKFFLKVFNGYFIYFIAANELMNKKDVRIKVYKNIWLSIFVLSFITFLVYSLGLSNSDTTRGLVRYNGLYNDPGTPSYLAVLCLVFCNLYHEFNKTEKSLLLKAIYFLTFPLSGYILYITLTKSALVMLVVFIIMWYGIYRKRLLVIAPVLIAGIIISFSLSTGLNTRFETEMNFVQSGGDAEAAKSVGTGRVNRWENLMDEYAKYDIPTKFLGTSSPLNAHNQYIAYLMQSGIFGLTLFLIVLYRFSRKLAVIYRKTGSPEIFSAMIILTMYMFYGLTGHPFYYTTLLWYLMIMLAMINVYNKGMRIKVEQQKQQLLQRNRIPNEQMA